jgi:hypothetical protein
MGSKPKAPVIVIPPTPAPTNTTPDPAPPLPAAVQPPPAPQESPTAQRGSAAASGSPSQKGPAALAAGLGMNDTVLTGPRGLPGLPTENRTKSLLGL